MVLQLKNVTKFYKFGKNKQLVIEDLSINFPRVGMVAIVGKSGCGKSTLLNLIAGIEKADNGKVMIDGHELDYRQIDKYQSKYISYVYQFYNLVDALTVYENIILLAKIKGKKISMSKLHFLTDKLAITPLLEYFPKELSGGQKQRVSLIRAFLCDTPILLADEPTGALDSDTGRKVFTLLQQMSRAYDSAVVVVTHNAAVAPAADRVIRLKDGRIHSVTDNSAPVSMEEVEL